MRYLPVFVFIVLFSCNGQKKTTMGDGNGANSSKEGLILLLQDNYSGADTSETLIIRDQKSLQKFFSKINRTRKPGIPIPVVDFTKDMVLIHCPGEQPLGEQVLWSIANENDKEIRLRPTVTKMKKRGTSSVTVSPFSVYKIPLTSKRITFQKEQ